ncbi:TonB-dependent receptor plug domain-containing protein [Sulfuricurvum sp.]|uniref:TonB-dependent receptor plug domain-containing protein n=1 Tax=Sulfuricurvum sp. TaxID=2025608 RepID=UPI002E33E89F|nr:TonB-dependent receptor [Sulfuricurvum sp.]HEX5330173.1 TonB-dependent receptor [Sulfuricurvum sp.]
MNRLSILCITLLLTQPFLLAQSSDDLDKVLEEATTIATKTKLNADYVPGTVSVISGEKLKSLGINNLAEQNAFDMIVGFDSSTLSLRGAGSIYGSQGNKIKWMINDKPISAELWGMPKLGVGQIVFPIPTDAIDRIEIVRGPGSAIYGGNAIYGVVNIITKKDSGALFTTLSQTQSDKFGRGVGALGTFEKNDLKVSAIASTEKHDGWNLSVQSDSRSEYGNLPNANVNTLFISDFSYKNFDFWAYRLEAKNDYSRLQWDISNNIPPDNNAPVQSNVYTMLGMQGKFTPVSNVLITAKTGINEYTNDAEVLFNTYGTRTIDYVESTKYFEGTVETSIDSHRLLGGVYAGFLEVERDYLHQTWNNTPSLLLTNANKLIVNNPKRINRALYLQDEIEINEQSTLTLGGRFDSYSDGREALSPRIGYVYQYDESNILKGQYSRAFRPPSFSEQYSPNNAPFTNKTFESETADTIELSYIYKTNNSSIKTTVFNSTTSDMITFHDYTYTTINLATPTTINGLEIELTKKFDALSFGSNVAFYDTHRGEIKEPHNNYNPSEFALSANYLANIYMTLNSDTSYPTTFWYHYTGSKHRVSSEKLDDNGAVLTATNGSVSVQDYLNITQKINGIAKDLDLEFGVKNVFGKTLRTLYFPLNPTDTCDVPYMKQTFWINVLYKF